MLDVLAVDLEAWWSRPGVRKAAWVTLCWATAGALMALSDAFFDRVDDRLTRFGVPARRLSRVDFLVDAFLVLVAALVTLGVLGVGQALWGALAVTSVAGVVVALAAQRVGQNLLAGLVILFERPFVVGDTVDVGDETGEVRRVSLHSTTLVTPEGLQVLVPNQRILDANVTNYSAREDRRIRVSIDLAEAADLDRVRGVLEEAVRTERHLVGDRPIRVYARESLDEGVRFEVRYWVEREHYAEHCLPSALERLLDAVNDADLETARPAQKVYVEDAGPTPGDPSQA